MRGHDPLPLLAPEELDTWLKPDTTLLKNENMAKRCDAAIAALHSLLTGAANLTCSARMHKICPKRLRAMAQRAPQLARDGQPWGFRVCVPWGAYCRAVGAESDVSPEMPTQAHPHAMEQLFAAQPEIGKWVDGYDHPLPPGRPPRSFDRLHAKIVKELKRLGLASVYPLNQRDEGRRALLRYLRRQRVGVTVEALAHESNKPVTTLADIFANRLYDRAEFDGHSFDIEAKIGIRMPNGGEVRRKVTALWWLPEVETESRAILAWELRVGRNYNNLDATGCVARTLKPWCRRTLTIPGLTYAPGACMPSGLSPAMALRRALLLALDNHKGQHSIAFEQAFCRAHDGVLNMGRAHEPRTRAVIEQLFNRLEKGAFRDIAGGFEPAKRLGEDKIRISNFSPDDCPLQLHLLEELLDVIVANYNATPHPSLGDLSPLQYLQMHATDRDWFYEAHDNEVCSREMDSVLVPVTIVGNRANGDLPHVNYKYVKYRNSDMDAAWELLGQRMLAKVYRRDLCTLTLYRTVTQPYGVLRAMRPWGATAHDETTRQMIFQWSRQGKLKIRDAECAIAAYIAFLNAAAKASQQAVDQLARIQHKSPGRPVNGSTTAPAKVRAPRSGWVSLDKLRDTP